MAGGSPARFHPAELIRFVDVRRPDGSIAQQVVLDPTDQVRGYLNAIGRRDITVISIAGMARYVTVLCWTELSPFPGSKKPVVRCGVDGLETRKTILSIVGHRVLSWRAGAESLCCCRSLRVSLPTFPSRSVTSLTARPAASTACFSRRKTAACSAFATRRGLVTPSLGEYAKST